MIDLDANATTRPTPEVIDAVVRALRDTWHNPSSVHRAGQAARAVVELAREQVAALLGARPREVTFTGTGTESIHLAIRGTLARLPAARRVLVTTPVEHAAIRDLAAELSGVGAGDGIEVRTLPVDGGGLVDPADVARLARSAGIVSVQWANNETGAVQPIAAIAAAARAAGAVVHVDATQWVGKEPTDLSGAWCDLLTCAPHKFHGPKGVGVLWARGGLGLRPLMPGSQELGRRAGTENVPGIAGAGVAAEQAARWLADPAGRNAQRALRDRFEQGVLAACPGSVVNTPTCPTPTTSADPARRLWNTSNIGFPRLEAEALLLSLSERGLNASAGAACSSGSLEPSPVLRAMGVPEHLAHGSVRFSLSRETTAGEIDRAMLLVADAVRALGGALPPV